MFIVELNLKKPEMAVVLDSLGLSTLIGMPADAFEVPDHLKQGVATAGVAGLVEKKLAEKAADGSLAIDADLRAIVKVAADAELAAVIIKNIPGIGKQLIVHGAVNNAVVEHTRPTEDSHRLAVMQSQSSLPVRWAEILPMEDDRAEGRIYCDLEVFPKIVALANAGSYAEAIRLFPSDTPPELAGRLVRDMNSPRYSANIAFLWREQGLITDARDLMILVGAGGAWVIAQSPPGKSTIQIERANREAALRAIVDQWKSVARAS